MGAAAAAADTAPGAGLAGAAAHNHVRYFSPTDTGCPYNQVHHHWCGTHTSSFRGWLLVQVCMQLPSTPSHPLNKALCCTINDSLNNIIIQGGQRAPKGTWHSLTEVTMQTICMPTAACNHQTRPYEPRPTHSSIARLLYQGADRRVWCNEINSCRSAIIRCCAISSPLLRTRLASVITTKAVLMCARQHTSQPGLTCQIHHAFTKAALEYIIEAVRTRHQTKQGCNPPNNTRRVNYPTIPLSHYPSRA